MVAPAWRVSLACLLGYVALPWAEAKVPLALAALAAAWCAPPLSFPSLRRPLLGVCFALALLVLPYWLYFQGEQPAPWWQIAWCGAMAAAGWAWVRAVDSLTGAPEPSTPLRWWKAAVVSAGVLALNWRALFQVMASRGDEPTHLMRLWGWLAFLKYLVASWAGPAAIVLGLAGWWLRRRTRGGMATAALGGAAGLWIYAVIDQAWRADLFTLPRYPGLEMWWQLTALAWAPVKSWIAQEGLYRIVPLLSAAALGLYLMRGPLAGAPALSQLAAALAVASLPTVRYYSTLLYLDLPLALAMTVTCCEVERLAAGAARGRIAASAGWYALALAGFLKETAAVFVPVAFAFVAGRAAGRRVRLFWALAGPLALLLAAAGAQQRGYRLGLENLAVASNYRILGGALWEQYGLALALAAAGSIVLAKERRWLLIGFAVTTAAAYTGFYLADGATVMQQGVPRPRYLGHARFLLAWLPAVVVFGAHAVRRLGGWAGPAVAGLVLAANLAWYPVTAASAPRANWGDYVSDTSDHFYPYDQAFERGRAEFPGARAVAVVGADFYYPFSFYQAKHGWPSAIQDYYLPPAYSAEAYRQEAERAIRGSPDLVWVHVMDHLPAEAYRVELPGYVLAGEYRSKYHRILLYRRS